MEKHRAADTLDTQNRAVVDHLEQLGTMVVGGKGGAANPVSLALFDKVKAEYEVVVAIGM